MGELARRDFSAGWVPSADAFNAPKNALLRMDNLVLDELGAISLRQGSVKINSSAFSDVDIHSLFTISLNGSRCRFCGASNRVYLNGTATATTIAGSGDVSFGAHMGQALYARSTTKKKHDGTTERNWGIAAPGAAPTLTAIAADSKTFASCASTELPVVTVNEGALAFAADKAGTANAAVELTPDATTARATATKTFAAATDFTVYNAGQIGTDDDLVELDVFVTEPQYLERIALMIDFTDGLFQSDYAVYEFINGEPVEVALNKDEFLASDYSAEGFERDDVRSRLEDRTLDTVFRIDRPVANAGWNHFSVPRGKMTRVGSTSGANWSTVRAVRVSFVGLTGGSGAAVRFDQIHIIGGAERALTGRYKAIVVAVRNDGVYQAKSVVSAASSEIEVKGQGIRATVDATTIGNLDTQVNELWLYLMGGRLDGYYRFTVKTGGPFSGAQTIDATSSDRSALIADLRLETDNTTPPDSIIGIEGPHYDRTLCLTATHLYPSRQRNPDSFSTGEVVRVGDAAESALWIKKVNEQVYVGTTRDIYRFDGDWTKLPDGSLNVIKRPLGLTSPPISSAVTVGTIGGADLLVYLSSDGWRVLGGGLLITEAIDLLWRGYTRHGVYYVNVVDSTARFRVAISKGVLFAITPEGSDTTSSVVIHAYHFAKQRWYRHVYPQAFRSIYREPDGTLVAGDAAGFIRTLDLATKTDDGAVIAVTLWTPIDDNAEPFSFKNAQNLQLRLETGSASATVAYHLNGSSSANSSVSTTQALTDVLVSAASAVSEFTQLQLRITGTFSTFNFRGYALRYLDSPPPLVLYDTGFVDLAEPGELAWVRRLHIKARSTVNLTLTPYYDGIAGEARTVTVDSGKVVVYPVALGREDKGTTARFILTGASPFLVYWMEAEFESSGNQNQKKKIRMAVA